ncbi:MAG: ABC transporter substrate-binding protein [Sphingobacteriales bacterium]
MTFLAGTAAGWPLFARAQEPGKIYRIGFFGPAQTSEPPITFYRSFLAKMREYGFSEGQNLRVEFRALEDSRGMSVNAGELIGSQPELIVVTGPETALRSVAGASSKIPIVIVAVNYDPIQGGYVKSLRKPGGNITGVVFQQLELAQKQIELLKETFPGKTRVAILVATPSSVDQLEAAQRTAKSLNLQVQPLRLDESSSDFAPAMRSAVAEGAQMVLVLSGPGWARHRSQIADLAIQFRLPTMFIARHYVEAGGLISYGADFSLMFGKAAAYAAKILKGEKPVDLPVEQATKFELVVNLKTAKAIGTQLPESLMLRADQILE